MKIGIDLGGSHVGVGLVENEKLIDSVDSFILKSEIENIENSILDKIDVLLNELLTKNNVTFANIEKMGVAVPGTVTNGKITAYNLNFNNFDLKSKLSEKYGIDINVRNDGKCAALVEKIYGSMKNYDDCVFLNIGTGIGGAAFLGGKLLEPKKFSGFEFGHMTLVKDGIECTCGKRGCFERYCSIKALKNKITNTLNIDETDISGQYLRENIMVEFHDKIQDDINEFIDYLRVGVCNLIDIFEPEIICFGGSFSYYEGHPVLEKLIQKIYEPSSTFNNSKPKIVTALFKNDAGIMGATL